MMSDILSGFVVRSTHRSADKMKAQDTRIEEVSSASSPHLRGMADVMGELFPDLTPSFDGILGERCDPDGSIAKQVFAGLSGRSVVGLLQLFYHVWRGGLVAVVDLVGVMKAHRSCGLGPKLMRQAIAATRQVAETRSLRPCGLIWLTEPDRGEADSWPVRRVRMYEKMGAQVRRDLIYRFDGQPESNGEIILWYPLSSDLEDVSTRALAWLLWQSGGLPEQEFARRYGEIGEAEQMHPETTSKSARSAASEASDA